MADYEKADKKLINPEKIPDYIELSEKDTYSDDSHEAIKEASETK